MGCQKSDKSIISFDLNINQFLKRIFSEKLNGEEKIEC